MQPYLNPLQLPQVIIQLRLSQLDPEATCQTFKNDVRDIQVDPDVIIETQYYAQIGSTLDDDTIWALLAQPLTAEEIDIATDHNAAAINFKNLPNWATWKPAQADTYITNNILNGWNQSQADSWIDTTVTNIASTRTALKQIAGNLITIRALLVNMAKAILFIRDLIIRVRK